MGLHFDEARYREIAGNAEAIKEKILEEADLLGRAVGNRIDIVSMHRPSKLVLDEDIEMPGMINSYGRTYSKDFKYLSDSRRKWKELVEEIIASEEYERLHILTHAFWYKEEECDLRKTVMAFVNSGNREKYESLNRNFTDLETVMRKEDIL